MRLFAEQCSLPFTPDEQSLFGWGHVSTDLIGFSVQCLPQGYYSFLEPVLKRFFSGRIKIDEARAQIHAVLSGCHAMKMDIMGQDCERKRKEAEAQRLHDITQRAKRQGPQAS